MKIGIIVLAVSLWSFQLQGQSKNSDRILSELSKSDNVFNMSYSKPMEDFFDMDFDLNGKEKHLSGDFESGKILVLNEKKNAQEIIRDFKREGFRLYKFEEDEEKEQDQVHLLYLTNGKKVSEAHFLINGADEFLVFSLYGDLKLDDK
ncbi:MAG: DUF4252 domain-containing protein [Vicingaceae bacterium]